MSNKILIGIDPDIDKSGVAIYNGSYTLLNLEFPKLVELINSMEEFKENVTFYVEIGELNSSNFHVKFIPKTISNTRAYCAKIGANVGKNFATAKLICDLIEYNGYKIRKVRPTSSKKDADYFKRVSKLNIKTNQENRDAFFLIFGR